MVVRGVLAIAVLVSGAWLVSDFVTAQPRERTGAEVVKAQCIKCHGSGVSGAPKIDDRSAWAPRMKNGLDATVRSAIKGHGAMPARGGVADLSDTELRAAILYMFYPAGAEPKAAAAPPAPPDAGRKTVGGVDFHLGVTPAGAAPVSQDGPRGKGYYYVTIALRDAASHDYIKDARVEARAANAVTGGETKKLELVTVNATASYGNFFRMEGSEPYAITVRVQRKGDARPLEAKFDFVP